MTQPAERRKEKKSPYISRSSLEPQPCEMCGKLFGPRPGERPAAFIKRHTCSRECGRKLQVITVTERTEKEWRAPRSDETTGAYPEKVNEALRLFHKRYRNLTPYEAGKRHGRDAADYWLQCLNETRGNL
jgi:hypothetical protein